MWHPGMYFEIAALFWLKDWQNLVHVYSATLSEHYCTLVALRRDRRGTNTDVSVSCGKRNWAVK